MSSVIRENGEKDLFAEVALAADELYSIRETFFPVNPDEKTSLLQSKSDLALQLLDAIPPERRKLSMQRATYEYLKGKILDVFPDYKKEAEDHLSKAVKLNPSLAGAWLCLGNCIWKKGDLASAKNCFMFGLSKGPNKEILCQLSMLERKMAQGAEDQAEIVEESIKHAKEAITVDVKDGYSWYNLGNAYHTSFFVTGAWEHGKLLQSLKAYQNAERDEKMKCSPDLYFNCATVNKYLENYERALTGFEAAALKDPGLNATEEVQKVVYLLEKLDSLLRGQNKSKRLSSLTSSLNSINVNPSYRRATIDFLSEGLNKGVVLIGKVMFFVKHGTPTPLYYVLCDSAQACYVLSVYGVQNEAIKEGDVVTLLQPYRNPSILLSTNSFYVISPSSSSSSSSPSLILFNPRFCSVNMSTCNAAAAPEQLCYIPCNFCNIVLAVSVPCSSLYEIVTVRCGHCTNLWSVNMAAAFHHHSLSSSSPPSSPWQDHHAQVPNYTSSEYMGNGSSSKFNHKMPTRPPITTSIEERIVNRPPEKRARVPSAYNQFIKEEIQRIKANNPDISHREAFSTAAKNWAHFPHIHFGLMLDSNSNNQPKLGVSEGTGKRICKGLQY